jgi:hypothetical protein
MKRKMSNPCSHCFLFSITRNFSLPSFTLPRAAFNASPELKESEAISSSKAVANEVFLPTDPKDPSVGSRQRLFGGL